MQSFHRFAVVLLAAVSVVFAGGRALGQADESAWEWSDADKARMNKMASGLKNRRDGFDLRTRNWSVRTEISARFTVELAYYLDGYVTGVMEAAPELQRAQSKVLPRITVYGSEADYLKQVPDGGSGKLFWTRVGDRVTDLHIYTYLPENEPQDFPNMDRRAINHLVVRCMVMCATNADDTPPWFRLGHAMCFDDWDPRYPAKQNWDLVRAYVANSPEIKRIVEDGRYPSLKELLSIRITGHEWYTHGDAETQDVLISTRGFMACLLTDPAAADTYEAVFGRARSGRSQLITRKELADIEKTWHRYLDDVIKQARQPDAQDEAEG